MRVTPNARRQSIDGIERRADDTCHLKLKVTAPADKGAANTAVIALLADALDLPRSAITLVSGQTARTKRISISGSPDILYLRLSQLAHD